MPAQRALTGYVAAVIVVMAAVIGIRWLVAGPEQGQKTLYFGIGFFFGMIAMYIAMHVYRDNIWPWLSRS